MRLAMAIKSSSCPSQKSSFNQVLTSSLNKTNFLLIKFIFNQNTDNSKINVTFTDYNITFTAAGIFTNLILQLSYLILWIWMSWSSTFFIDMQWLYNNTEKYFKTDWRVLSAIMTTTICLKMRSKNVLKYLIVFWEMKNAQRLHFVLSVISQYLLLWNTDTTQKLACKGHWTSIG